MSSNYNTFSISAHTTNAYKEKRRQLIDSLRRNPELDPYVLDAMELLPRELFVSPAFINRTYEDSALPIDCSQTISQPYTVAYMTSALRVRPNDKILEIGTGSGYQAALLHILGARVYTIERHEKLYNQSKALFAKLGMNIQSRLGDGTLGWREYSPYQSIITTAAAPQAPRPLIEQLGIGGRLVIPIGDKDQQTMHIIERVSKDEWREEKTDAFKFVPLIGREGWAQE
jgi:protein-L-isoaspartate(D-aspartate) O-methyltransferase